MQNYDNYRPEINYSEELPVMENKKAGKEKRSQRVSRNKKEDSKKQPSQKAGKPESNSFPSRTIAWFKSPSFRILAGIFIGCLTVYLAVSFFGYFSSCIEDQSSIARVGVGSAENIANPGGEGGARLSELFINRGFGLGSMVIIVWLGAISLKLLVGRPKFRALDFTIKCIVALITVSLIIGLTTYSMHTHVNWGGYHGTYVNEFIIHFIGAIGAILLSLFMMAVFVTICLRDIVKWIINKRRKHMEKRRRIAAEMAARRAREEEIQRMQEQEKIDDLKAGETSVIGSAEITDENEPDISSMKFDSEDGVLYDLNPLEASPRNVQENSNAGGGTYEYRENPVDEETEESEKPDNENLTEISGHAEEDENSTEDSEGKMIVNVNTIGQTDKKHFKSEVEMYESHNYKFPPFSLLHEGKVRISVDTEEQLENKNRIEKTLLDFGIPITRIEATVGPTVTLYEIVPDKGVKISKIRSLVDDIALSLSAIGVRIIAPIPGKGTVGIEVANKDPQTVSMQTVIKSKKYQESRYELPIALGSTISNEVYIADLAKMPHLLVAGATGQGKSVGLNAIIASLLYCKAPHEIKFVMIDPKQVEFSLYNKLKDHYMAAIPGCDDEEPVITDMQKVEATLSSLCVEMDNRYTLLKKAHTRNIEEYNAKVRNGLLNPAEGHKFLPYIVVIVDEFGDLIMVSGKNVEMPIARLAQKARAVGMHVVIATQRPSTNVITGIIKANFPARISFKVSSGVDSRTVLDTTGAQHLIGRGDMLIFNNSEMIRVQCAFIDTPEVEAICDYIERQPYPTGIYELPEPKVEAGDNQTDGAIVGDRDPLFEEVARSVVNSGTASTSSVQRHYSIGYNRAGKIMDQLEACGIVGPSQGGKPRAVLVDMIGLENILATLG
ncbi:MAG: DNA translocase FtsK [Candidatus Amulumruptor caecigallinarius]|nr:DNA translocase FtsK [Candidatus Amulumruptor caecigallinarius]